MPGQGESGHGEIRNAIAELRLAQNDPQAAAASLAPVRTGAVPLANPGWMTHAHWLEAIAREALGDAAAAGRALELALDCGESDGLTLSFVVHPGPGRTAVRHSQTLTSHAALIAETLSRLPGGGGAPVTTAVPPPVELLTESETRILRYLPTNLPAPEIARNLCVSVHTVRTHMQHVYEKLGVHDRTRAVEQGVGRWACWPPPSPFLIRECTRCDRDQHQSLICVTTSHPSGLTSEREPAWGKAVTADGDAPGQAGEKCPGRAPAIAPSLRMRRIFTAGLLAPVTFVRTTRATGPTTAQGSPPRSPRNRASCAVWRPSLPVVRNLRRCSRAWPRRQPRSSTPTLPRWSSSSRMVRRSS